MVIRWVELELSEEDKNWHPKSFCEKHLPYQETLREIHAALQDRYEFTTLSDNEFTHQIGFSKYPPKSNLYYWLFVNGTREEMNQIQEDKIVKQSLFRH